MKTHLPVFAAILLLASCDSDDDRPGPTDTNIRNEIRLNDLRAGQSNQFLAFNSTCTGNDNNNFNYTGDTLVAEVITLAGGLGIRESFTPGSTNFAESEPAIYPVIPGDSYLLLPQREASWLFFFFGNDTLPVGKPATTNLHQGDCFVEYQNGEPFIGEEVGAISPFEIGDLQYFDKRVVSCVPPIFNLDAYLLFDNKQLFISMTLSHLSDPVSMNGFALLPKD